VSNGGTHENPYKAHQQELNYIEKAGMQFTMTNRSAFFSPYLSLSFAYHELVEWWIEMWE